VGTGGGQCDGPNEQATAGNTKGALVVYEGSTAAATPIGDPATLPAGCVEMTTLEPFVTTVVPMPSEAPTTFELTLDTSAGVFWKVNGMAMDINWGTPSLSYVLNGTYSLPAGDNGVTIDTDGWVYYVIINESPLPHPIHLHGHDFWIIATGNGTFAPNYNLQNPIRRDTHLVQGNSGVAGTGGYAVIAFQADNPGAWLMHCHIPFHISGGLGVQFLERPSEIMGTLGDVPFYTQGCSAWNTFQTTSNVKMVQSDSGLKKLRKRKIRRRQ
jgi:FtsP/CotA-like multicopper oxidase with cupredoxin domain